MPKTNPWRSAAVAVLAASIVFAAPSLADWPASGLPLATGPSDQTLPVGLTGVGGQLHAFWIDRGPSATHALFAQHVAITGNPANGWPAGGRGIVVPPARPSTPRITPDGSGGAIIAWYDVRTSGGPRGIYAVRADGEAAVVPGWSSSGTPICTATNTQGLGPLNDLVAICGDGAGGAFVAWTDARNTPLAGPLIYDVVAHHVLANGLLDAGWPATGRSLTSGSGYKYPHSLVADGAGGFWLVTENSNATERVAATQHGSDGTELGRWTSPSFASRAIGESDGAGGLFLTWRDCRDCMSGSDAIYAVRLAPGAVARAGWLAGGIPVGVSPGDDDLPVIVATGDGAAMIAWLETGTAPDAYVARRVEADGTFAPAWQGGERIFAQSSDILSGWPLIARDGDGGAMFAFRRNRPNLFGSRVDVAAVVPAAFPDTGLSLCTVSGNQFPASLVSDGLSGAYLLWEDRRDATASQTDVYVTHFTRDGEIGETASVPGPIAPSLVLSAPWPNPASSSSSRFVLEMPTAGPARVEVIDLAGRLVSVVHDGALGAGTQPLQWDGEDRAHRRAPPSVYRVRAVTPSGTVARTIVRLP